MKAYRLYLLDQYGHFDDVRLIDAPEDEAAVEEAAQIVADQPMELWDRARKVKFFPADPS
jgi:hypothetical protein